VIKFKAWAHRLVGGLQVPEKHDGRSRRVVAVIECVLNQNARDEGAAVSPAVNHEVLRLCREHAVGLLQMPCPEMRHLGLARTRPPGTSIRDALDTDAGRQCCREISIEVVDRLQDYARNGCDVLAVLGGNPQSPGCAVHPGPDGLLATSGVLMQELQAELHRRRLEVPFLALRDADASALAADVQQLERVFQWSRPGRMVNGQTRLS
jgi:predicted secreted protein